MKFQWSREVDAIEVYDNNNKSKQITWIIPLLKMFEILCDLLADNVIIIRITVIANG